LTTNLAVWSHICCRQKVIVKPDLIIAVWWHQGRNKRGQGGPITRAPNDNGRRKVPTASQVLSSIQ